MKTIALRFAENFAPDCGTVTAHKKLIDKFGYAWYGKLGSPISKAIAKDLLSVDNPRILLIHSGGQDRWWAFVDAIQRDIPPLESIPAYYRYQAKDFGCWFRVKRFEKAEKDIMSKCVVASSGKPLTQASRHSMSPYFIINFKSET